MQARIFPSVKGVNPSKLVARQIGPGARCRSSGAVLQPAELSEPSVQRGPKVSLGEVSGASRCAKIMAQAGPDSRRLGRPNFCNNEFGEAPSRTR